MARPSRQKMHADDPTFLWKVILRLFAIILAIIGIGTLAWALATNIRPSLSPPTDSTSSYGYYNNYNNYDEYTYFQDFVFLPWSFLPLSLSIIWNIANIAVLLSRNRPMHPGANVGCDLVLWLFFAVTGTFATFGALEYIVNYIGGHDSPLGYEGGTYSNGTAITCGEFTSCDAQTSYSNALQHKGVVITVGCAMQFAVLLIHFALFISACRYTHARRYNTSSMKAKAITAEATEIARKMIADLTAGPDAQFRPLLQQPQEQGMQQTGGQWPLQQSEAQQPSQPGSRGGQPPIQQDNTAQQQQVAREQAMQPRYDATSPISSAGDSSSNALGKRVELEPPEIMVESPHSTHPALRDQDSMPYA